MSTYPLERTVYRLAERAGECGDLRAAISGIIPFRPTAGHVSPQARGVAVRFPTARAREGVALGLRVGAGPHGTAVLQVAQPSRPGLEGAIAEVAVERRLRGCAWPRGGGLAGVHSRGGSKGGCWMGGRTRRRHVKIPNSARDAGGNRGSGGGGARVPVTPTRTSL